MIKAEQPLGVPLETNYSVISAQRPRPGRGSIEGYRGPWLYLTTLLLFGAILGAVCWVSLGNF